MKIRRSNPLHWVWLGLFALTVCLALLLRPIRRRGGAPLVFLYGHKLNGNLLALYEFHHQSGTRCQDIDLRFLTMDPVYCRELTRKGIPNTLAWSPAAVLQLSQCAGVISDHGLHVLVLALRFSRMFFVDVWHGIPFKGFDAGDFKVQHRYTEIWVPSPMLQRFYVEKFGFSPDRVRVTGYARTDRLVHAGDTSHCELPGWPGDRPVVLLAPTWKQDDSQRSPFPFGLVEEAFFALLKEVSGQAGCHFLLRMHLNAGPVLLPSGSPVTLVPADQYPDTEELLTQCDVLVSDWSSIAFDFLLLNRPAVFLDVPAPFAKGFSLGPEFRYGEVVQDAAGLQAAICEAVKTPDRFMRRYAERYARVREAVYGEFADGRSAARCHERLREMLTVQPG